MQKPRLSVEQKLEQLSELNPSGGAETIAQIRDALQDRHYRIVAKAAKLCVDALLYDLEDELLKAYQRFLNNPGKTDPNCIAKKSLAKALVELDCGDVEFYLEGILYRQMEPVWGGSVDSAADIRCSCAMGLVANGHPRALHDITTLLFDPEPAARLGAARAIACANPREAALLLHCKVLSGDVDPEIIGECFIGLLQLEPEESVPFVASFLSDQRDLAAVREQAALALGASRLAEALAPLQSAYAQVIYDPEYRDLLLRAIALHRSDEAFDWLLSQIEDGEKHAILSIIHALAVYSHNPRLGERLQSLLQKRGESQLLEEFQQLFI